MRENGGQYSHGASWIIDGFIRLAAAARARRRRGGGRAPPGARFRDFRENLAARRRPTRTVSPTYGLIPIQQPADIYDGYGHGGRGGWSWYTGSAARMLSAAYAVIGIEEADGQVGRRATTCSSPKAG